jgi:hypothetical protein
MRDTPTRYPLAWPVGWKRTPDNRREYGRFGQREQKTGRNYASLEWITVSQACQRLLQELERMAVNPQDVIISTNVRTRLDGLPYSNEKEPQDPGAAVYWRDQAAVGGPNDRCMAIDRYNKVAQNIAALAATIEAMRAIERHGGAAILDRAFTGFAALPAPIVAGMKRPWREVLEYGNSPAQREAIQRHYRILASSAHPDKGGTAERMAELNAARDEALQEAGHA